MSYHNVRDKFGRFAPGGKMIRTKKSKKKAGAMEHILNVFLLDASGSMSGKESGVVEGFNEILSTARKDKLPSTEMLSIFGFNYKKVEGPINSIQRGHPSGSKIGSGGTVLYASDMGGTALYDSTARIINEADSVLLNLPAKTAVIVTIFTDGEENVSRNWTQRSLTELIKAKQNLGWVINYIGAGDQAHIEKTSGSIGIFASNSLGYANTTAGTKMSMQNFAASRSNYTAKAAVGEAVADGFFSND